MKTILVIAEQRGGSLNPVSMETVAAGQQLAAALGAEIDVGVIGDDVTAAVEELSTISARQLLIASDPDLEPYRAETFVPAAQALLERSDADFVLFPHTYLVCDYAPRLAARYRRLLINDCIGFRHESGETLFVRQLFRSKVNADIDVIGDSPHFISFQSGAFQPEQAERASREPTATAVDVDINAAELHTRADNPAQEETGGVDLGKAELIVSVGRGIGEQENIALAEQLARALGAEVGSSRPLVDAGWMPKSRQVGSSGNIVSPKLYLALGISGASQHMIGAKGARTLVAINKDAKAPIFAYADYGIIGDVMDLIPALIESLPDE